jgi:hypothetical protein
MFNMRDANYRKELRRNCIFNKDGFEPNRPYSEVDEPFCD